MDNIETLIEYIKQSNNIVFFGGAGVSTESGIPDFRSKDGLYNQHDIQFEKYSPEYLLSHTCLYQNSDVFFEYYRQKMDTRDIQPNITHLVLTKLEKMGKLKAIVTQNIDGLHQKAGSENVLEIHGTTHKNYCDQCKKIYPSDYLFTSNERVPRCDCGGMIRPDVTMYQEALPFDTVEKAIKAIRNADLLIIGGTSLTVYPANQYIYEFKGKHMVVINKDPINVSLKENDLFIEDNLSNVFKTIEKSI